MGIRQDAAGRYCLNDLHKAAGGENRHRPSLWISNQQTQSLIDEVAKAGITALESIKGGDRSGTFVAKELVYAYAMWISTPIRPRRSLMRSRLPKIGLPKKSMT